MGEFVRKDLPNKFLKRAVMADNSWSHHAKDSNNNTLSMAV